MPNEESAAARARWLAEVAGALNEARQVIMQLGAVASDIQIVALNDRIDALAHDIEMMQRMRSTRHSGQLDPEWSNDVPWSLSA